VAVFKGSPQVQISSKAVEIGAGWKAGSFYGARSSGSAYLDKGKGRQIPCNFNKKSDTSLSELVRDSHTFIVVMVI
jgi:hypothetical protein